MALSMPEQSNTGINKKKRKSCEDLSKTSRKRNKKSFKVNKTQKINSNSSRKRTRKNTNREIIVDLSSAEEDEISDSNPLILNYERISLYENDLDCFNENEWLKDNVVDLALAGLRKTYERTGQAYLFNSLFFSKLRTVRDNSNIEKKNYHSVTTRWFKDDILSNKRFWIIPICDKNHWYLIVIVRPRSNKPALFVLDSMKKESYDSVSLIKEFLKQKYSEEHKGKCKKIAVKIVDIPQQPNESDCGLYAIRSATLFLSCKAQKFLDLIEVIYLISFYHVTQFSY
ncbi:hypothetical protein BD770DRAFT_1797 [Pilaira anomala]|nr:hypothetical protein BD770DRAFT_1797 [Pilaira anomala]